MASVSKVDSIAKASIANLLGLTFPSTGVDGFTFKIDTSLGDGTAAFFLPLSGTVNFTVHWGDGSSDVITSTGDAAMDHTYASGGVYSIALDGVIGTWNSGTTTDITKVTDVEKWWTNFTAGTFQNFTSLTSDTATDYPAVTSLNSFYRSCSVFNGDIGNWDVSSVSNMFGMFQNASTFNNGGVVTGSGVGMDTWDVSNCTSFFGMFRGAGAFNCDIGGWTFSNSQNFVMSYMFLSAPSFNQNLGGWNMEFCTLLNLAFQGASSFNNGGVGGIGVGLDSWNVSNVTSLSTIFTGATSFNQPLNSWDVQSVTSMNSAFDGATSFNQPLDSWVVTGVTGSMEGMFRNAAAFSQDLNSWNVSSVSSMLDMFSGSAMTGDITSWSPSSVSTFAGMFRGTSFNQDIGGWNVSNSTSFNAMFQNNSAFNQDISGWSTVKATNLSYMFQNAAAFNQNLSLWNIALVTNCSVMLTGSGMSTANYDALLIGWAAQAPSIQSGVSLSTGPQYTSAAVSARNTLTSTYSWTISDGGLV